MRKTTLVAALAIVAAVPVAVAADHGKAGRWQTTISVDDKRMGGLTAAEQADFKSRGLDVSAGNALTGERCMTAAEVASNSIAAGAAQSPGCSFKDTGAKGNTYSGQLVCTQDPKGQGQLQITYDTPEHYTGTMLFTGVAGGEPVKITYRYSGRWVSADCGKMPH